MARPQSLHRKAVAFVLTLGLMGSAVHPTDAWDRESFQDLNEPSGDKISLNDEQHRELAYPASERPAWLTRVLAKLQARRGPNAELMQAVLLKQHGKPSHLLLVWKNYKGDPPTVVEIHRVKIISPRKVLLHGLWEMRREYLDVVEPTGHDVYGDGLPTIFIEVGMGGSLYSGYELVVLRLGKTVKNVAPAAYSLRPVIAGDLLGDGRHALLASNDRWAQYFYGCGACGPFVPTVFVWQRGRYAPACNRFQPYYLERIAWFETAQGVPEGEEAQYWAWKNVEYETNIVLNLIQMGRVDAGLARFRAMVERARANDAPGHAEPYFDWETAEDVTRDIGSVIEAAARRPDISCSLLETPSEGVHPGWARRVRSIR